PAPRPSRGPRPSGQRGTAPATPAPATTDYPGDFTGIPVLRYAPNDDRVADPGEVVWTWVPYEEDHSQGKDRPVLVIGTDGPWLLALPLTSQDHDIDAAQEAAEGRYWVDIGTGSWDAEGRASEVRVNRILRVDPQRVRRTAGRLAKGRFTQVAAAVAEHAR
ncbi:MAG: type II toxin-antitoxin system PemK/MazF family toxin, partial [Propionicimonas sp.]